MADFTYDQLDELLIAAVPEVRDLYEEKALGWGDDYTPDPGYVYATVLSPYLDQMLTREGNQEVLTRIFELLERLAQDQDGTVREIVAYDVLDILFEDPQRQTIAAAYMGAATKTLFENALAAQQNTSGQGALRQEAIPHSIPLSQYNDLLERDQEIEHLIDVVGIEGAVHRAIETILEVNPDPEFHLWARDWLAGNRRLSKLSEKYPRRQYWPARLGLEALEAQTTLSRADGAAHEVQYAAQGLLSGDLISARMAVKSALRHCDYFRQDR